MSKLYDSQDYIFNKKRLLKLIRSLSYKEGSFTLASGKKSDYYIDTKLTTLTSDGAYLTSYCMYYKIMDYNFDCIAGIELSSVPILGSIIVLPLINKELSFCIVRKQQKDHGNGRLIEGNLGRNVILIEDVVTTGESVIEAANKIISAGSKVDRVITLVDRREGGEENLYNNGLILESVFTIDELKGEYKNNINEKLQAAERVKGMWADKEDLDEYF